MFLPLFQLCLLAVTFPFGLPLEIILPDSTPIVSQSTQIYLQWMPGDPQEFYLGVYLETIMSNILPEHPSDVPVDYLVTNFVQDQNVTMIFNTTVGDDVRDHILKAWIVGPYHSLAYSLWFAVDGSDTVTGSGDGTISSLADPDVQSPTSSPTEEATSVGTLAQTKTGSRTGVIVGGVLGSLAFLSIASGLALFVLRKRRRARNSAPSRVFWKYLDEKKGPPCSEPLQHPSPTYSPDVQARPLSVRQEDYYHRTM